MQNGIRIDAIGKFQSKRNLNEPKCGCRSHYTVPLKWLKIELTSIPIHSVRFSFRSATAFIYLKCSTSFVLFATSKIPFYIHDVIFGRILFQSEIQLPAQNVEKWTSANLEVWATISTEFFLKLYTFFFSLFNFFKLYIDPI